MLTFSGVGVALLMIAYAATSGSFLSILPAKGILCDGASVVQNSSAIGGSAVKFGAGSTSCGGAPTSTPTPAPTATPAPPASGMILGLNLNGLGSNPGPDMVGAVKYVRADLKSWGLNASTFTNSGIKVDDLLQGPYSTSGIAGLGSATTWANTALGWYQSGGCTPSLCPMIEVLNEPGGHWFWGNNAMTLSNAQAYDSVLIATYNTFKAAYGASMPKVLASFDGGMSDGSGGWGGYMWQANSSIGNYIDGITVHPYDQTSTSIGNTTNVTNSHSQAQSLSGRNIPVYITEIGYETTPTASETAAGVKPITQTQLSVSLQCNNIYNFAKWAQGLGYVNAVMFFDYRDDTSDDGTYGVEYSDGSHKPSYAGLAAVALGQPNPCP